MRRLLRDALDVLATVLLVVAAGFFVWTQVENRWLRVRGKPGFDDVRNLRIAADTIRYAKGTGSVALVEFTDYECPFCRAYTSNTAGAVDTQLIDSGVLRHVILNFPLEAIHQRARAAAEAAECAGRQGRYWEMHAHLFSDPSHLLPNAFVSAGEALGLDEASFASCLSGEAAGRISADIQEGQRLGVQGTPTFFLGIVQSDGSIELVKRVNGSFSIDDLKRQVDAVNAPRRAGR